MAILTGLEIMDIVLMSLATGYIFMDMFRRPNTEEDPVLAYQKQTSFKERFLYSLALVSPAIILHEFGHKFVAMSFGLEATFNAAYPFLAVGIFLKLLSFPFLIIVPAYISTVGASAQQTFWIALAGPVVNGLLYIISYYMVQKSTEPKKIAFWRFSQYINGFLCIFNLLPIPGFDGSKVFGNLMSII